MKSEENLSLEKQNSKKKNSIEDLSVGKCIEVDLKCKTKNDAVTIIDEACSKLLVNPNTETYHYEIMED